MICYNSIPKDCVLLLRLDEEGRMWLTGIGVYNCLIVYNYPIVKTINDKNKEQK